MTCVPVAVELRHVDVTEVLAQHTKCGKANIVFRKAEFDTEYLDNEEGAIPDSQALYHFFCSQQNL